MIGAVPESVSSRNGKEGPVKHDVVRRLLGALVVGAALLWILAGQASQASGPQDRPAPAATATRAGAIDQEYTRRILDATPDKRILTELVDHMPASATVPSPLKFFGYVPGEDSRLTYYKDIAAYYQALAKASPRVTVWEMGKTEEGRTMVALAVADEATIKSLDKYKKITAQLTDPRNLPEAEAKRLIQTGKPIYVVSGSLHSSEAGSPEMLIELAYRLAIEESPFIQQIRNNAIVVITPAAEVDGHDRYVDNRRAADAGEPQPGMTYWGKYVAHDDNRDSIGKGLALTHNMLKMFLDLRPQVLHDLHESVTLLYTSAGTGPYNTEIPPVLASEWWWLSQTEVMEMTKRGVPGVYTYNYWDGWAPNFLLWLAVTHNSIGRFYETQSYGALGGGGGGGRGAEAAPGGRAGAPAAPAAAGAAGRAGAPAAAAPAPARGRTVPGGQSKEWYRPYPVPPEGVQWSGRANINMQQSALLIALNAVATHRQMFLENYYIKNKMMVEQGRTRAPFAYILPANQRRRAEAADMMNYFRRDGVEVHTATAAFTIGNVQVAPGDYILRLDQPYGGFVRMMLGTQWFPEQNPRPYDDTGWSLTLLRNLQVHRIEDKGIFDKPMALATKDFRGVGGVTGTGSVLVIDHTTDNSLATFRFANAKVTMSAAEQAFDLGGHHFAAGAFVIPNADRAALDPQIREAGLAAWATDRAPAVPMHDLDVPRIGYIHSWSSTQDEGWVRMALDALKVPYTYFADNVVRQGSLRAKYDVIIYPAGPVQVEGGEMPVGGTPQPYKKTANTPNIGTAPDQTEDRRGSLGRDGLRALETFVEAGGVVIAEGPPAAIFPDYRLASGLAVEQSSTLWAPGSVLKALLRDKTSPILYGYDQNALGVLYRDGPILAMRSVGGGRGGRGVTPAAQPELQPMSIASKLTTLDGPPAAPAGRAGAAGGFGGGGRGGGGTVAGSAPRVLLSYPADANDLLLSGALVGGDSLAGRPALVDVSFGKGHFVLFGIRPFWRFETQGSFFLAFNAILNWNDLDVGR